MQVRRLLTGGGPACRPIFQTNIEVHLLSIHLPKKRTGLSLIILLALALLCRFFAPALFVPASLLLSVFSLAFIIPKYLRGFAYHRLVRPLVYISVFFIPVMASRRMLPVLGKWDWWLMLLVPLGAGLPLLIRIGDLKIFLDKDMAPFLPRVRFQDLAVRTWYAFGGAIGEEVFFRGFLLPAIYGVMGWIAHLIVIVAFVGLHWFGYFHDEFKRRDYMSIILVGSICGLIAMRYQSLLLAVLIHLTFNVPVFLHFYIRFRAAKSDLS